MSKIKYISTYYSPVKFPDGKGLFTKTVLTGMRCKKDGEIIYFYVGAFYVYNKDHTDYEILKSESQFVILDRSINSNDLYQCIIIAVEGLKKFPAAKDFQIDRELQELTPPPFQVVENGINQSVQKIRVGHC